MIVNMVFDRKCGSVKGFNYLSIVRSDDFFKLFDFAMQQ